MTLPAETARMTALCCVCGNLRTCRRPRNHRRENYWLTGPIDREWHRETGDLKCGECGRVTRHAVIMPAADYFRDHAERITRIALGAADPLADVHAKRIRDAYRYGRQPNPYQSHLWSASDADVARKSGRSHVVTHCGESHPLPERSQKFGASGQLAPDPVRWDHEYEDQDTGMSWIEMDCPNCYRVANERRIARRRELLGNWLVWLLADPDKRVADDQVDPLIEAFEQNSNSKKVK